MGWPLSSSTQPHFSWVQFFWQVKVVPFPCIQFFLHGNLQSCSPLPEACKEIGKGSLYWCTSCPPDRLAPLGHYIDSCLEKNQYCCLYASILSLFELQLGQSSRSKKLSRLFIGHFWTKLSPIQYQHQQH